METKKTKETSSTPSTPAFSLPPIIQTVRIDLHGESVDSAQDLVTRYIRQARSRGWNKIRVITGRGNHINARGERGTLYKKFEEWIKDLEDVEKVEQYDGYYEVTVKKNIIAHNPLKALLNEHIKASWKRDIKKIQETAEKGDAEALTTLACCYDEGIGVEQSYSKATALYIQLAEKQKLASAQYEAGCRFYIGKGIRQNDSQAIKLLTLAADQGYVLAEFSLAEIYRKGFGAASIDHPRATQYYAKAAKRGHPEAARKLGCAYHEGLGIKVDQAQAIHWWKIACTAKDGVAAFNLAAAYQDGNGVPTDPQQSAHYLKLAAEYNDPDGQHILGHRYYFGDKEFPKDEQKGLEWLKRAADNGSSQAQGFLAHHHKSLQETKLAKKYLTDAAWNGDILAQYLITHSPTDQSTTTAGAKTAKEKKSIFPQESKTVKTDSGSPAFDLYFKEKMLEGLLNQPVQEILRLKNKHVVFEIIELLLCGDSTKRQMKKGIAILKELAKQECPEALTQLGTIYMKGLWNKIKKNVREGYKYLLQGAALKDPTCLCCLGHYWYEGSGKEIGDPIDYKKAYEYFFQAAEQGHANAANALGAFYSDGKCGLEKDALAAVKYFERAMALDEPKKRKELRQEKVGYRYENNTFQHASKNLAIIYLNGEGKVPKDEAKAIALFKQSADDGMSESALFLWTILSKREQPKEALNYLKLAAQLGNEKAIAMMEKMPEELKMLMRPCLAGPEDKGDHKAVVKTPASKQDQIEQLKKLSSCLKEELDWKISNDHSAWAYVSHDLQKKLIQIKELNQYLRTAINKRYVIVINHVNQCNLNDLQSLFEKAAMLSDSKENASGADLLVGPLVKHSFLTTASATLDETRGSEMEIPSSSYPSPGNAVEPPGESAGPAGAGLIAGLVATHSFLTSSGSALGETTSSAAAVASTVSVGAGEAGVSNSDDNVGDKSQSASINSTSTQSLEDHGEQTSSGSWWLCAII